jgi:hypothetical protein
METARRQKGKATPAVVWESNKHGLKDPHEQRNLMFLHGYL